MSAADAIALCREERAKRLLPPEPDCPHIKEDARFRWRFRRQQKQQSGWVEFYTTADERHTVSRRVALTGWVE
jgi:hypothetical protein